MHRDRFRGRGKNKYNAKKVEYDGFKFASQKEYRRYVHLKALERMGQIHGLKVEPRYKLITRTQAGEERPIKIKGPKGGYRTAFYTPDFEYTDDSGQIVIEDVKSPVTMTEASKLRIAVFEALYDVVVKFV